MATFAGVWGLQVARQVWFPELKGEPECFAGIERLRVQVREATRAGWLATTEAEALSAFRSALEPAWLERPALGRSCRDDKNAKRALLALDRLRYDEEAALRLSSGNIGKQNRRLDRALSGKH